MRDVVEYVDIMMFSSRFSTTVPPMLSLSTKYIGWFTGETHVNAPNSAVMSAATFYMPIFIPSSCLVKRVWWVNGATVTGGSTIEVGIYSDDNYSPKSKLVSGSATQGTAREVQFVDVDDIFLSDGMYWIAISSTDSSSNTTIYNSVTSSARFLKPLKFEQEITSLPSTATPSVGIYNSWPFCGISTTSSTTDVSSVPSMISSGSFSERSNVTIPPMVSVYTKRIGWADKAVLSNPASSSSYQGGGVAIYLPVFLAASCVVKRVWWANGATTSGGATVEVGIYRDGGSYSPQTLLVSGSATQGSATQVQFVDVTDTSLSSGLYWIAITASTNSNTTFLMATSGQTLTTRHRMQESLAQPLPSSATPVATYTSAIYLYGFSTTSGPS